MARGLEALAPAGHYMALRVRFAAPQEEMNALPPGWVQAYTREGFMLVDPVVRWVYSFRGAIRWSEIDLPDPRGVLEEARLHGLVYGVAVSHVDDGPAGLRSWGVFGRADREATQEEMDALLVHLRKRHAALAPPVNITCAEIEALRLVRDGHRLKQIAWTLGVTEGAVKQRLRNARVKLAARTGAEAVSRASTFGLL